MCVVRVVCGVCGDLCICVLCYVLFILLLSSSYVYLYIFYLYILKTTGGPPMYVLTTLFFLLHMYSLYLYPERWFYISCGLFCVLYPER